MLVSSGRGPRSRRLRHRPSLRGGARVRVRDPRARRSRGLQGGVPPGRGRPLAARLDRAAPAAGRDGWSGPVWRCLALALLTGAPGAAAAPRAQRRRRSPRGGRSHPAWWRASVAGTSRRTWSPASRRRSGWTRPEPATSWCATRSSPWARSRLGSPSHRTPTALSWDGELARRLLRRILADARDAPLTEAELGDAAARHWLEVDRPEGFRTVHAVGPLRAQGRRRRREQEGAPARAGRSASRGCPAGVGARRHAAIARGRAPARPAHRAERRPGSARGRVPPGRRCRADRRAGGTRRDPAAALGVRAFPRRGGRAYLRTRTSPGRPPRWRRGARSARW